MKYAVNRWSSIKRLQSRKQQLSELCLSASPGCKEKLASVAKQSRPTVAVTSDQRKTAICSLVLQVLTEEMQRLLGPRIPAKKNQLVGGIPADSDYIIFVIDTSGSMQSAAWPESSGIEMLNILDVYPEVKGIQVLNDMGQYHV